MSRTLADFPGLTPMDDAARQNLLSGQVDILSDMVEEESRFLADRHCPKCGTSPCLPTVDADRPFVDGQILPRRLLHCLNCGLEFEPFTGIQTNLGGVPHDEQRLSSMFIGGVGEDEIQ